MIIFFKPNYKMGPFHYRMDVVEEEPVDYLIR